MMDAIARVEMKAAGPVSGSHRFLLGAERGGFEPPVRFDPHTAFPVPHNRPLCHLSNIIIRCFCYTYVLVGVYVTAHVSITVVLSPAHRPSVVLPTMKTCFSASSPSL